MIMRFLSRLLSHDPMDPFELEMYDHFKHHLFIDPFLFEFLLWVDADTQVFPEGINRFVAAMASDAKVSIQQHTFNSLGCRNLWRNIVTK